MNYPAGAACDPNAPWNQPLDPEPRYTEQNVLISQTLVKEVKTDCEVDRSGNAVDAERDFYEQHYTPLEIMGMFSQLMEELIRSEVLTQEQTEKYAYLMRECKEWGCDELKIETV